MNDDVAMLCGAVGVILCSVSALIMQRDDLGKSTVANLMLVTLGYGISSVLHILAFAASK